MSDQAPAEWGERRRRREEERRRQFADREVGGRGGYGGGHPESGGYSDSGRYDSGGYSDSGRYDSGGYSDSGRYDTRYQGGRGPADALEGYPPAGGNGLGRGGDYVRGYDDAAGPGGYTNGREGGGYGASPSNGSGREGIRYPPDRYGELYDDRVGYAAGGGPRRDERPAQSYRDAPAPDRPRSRRELRERAAQESYGSPGGAEPYGGAPVGGYGGSWQEQTGPTSLPTSGEQSGATDWRSVPLDSQGRSSGWSEAGPEPSRHDPRMQQAAPDRYADQWGGRPQSGYPQDQRDLGSASQAPYAEQPYAEQRYAEQPYAEQQHAEQRYAEQQHAEQRYAEPQQAQPAGEPNGGPLSPQARAAAIRARAAAERGDAVQPSPAPQQPQEAAPTNAWAQRAANQAAQGQGFQVPSLEHDEEERYQQQDQPQRTPVRRVVLPPAEASGTVPFDHAGGSPASGAPARQSAFVAAEQAPPVGQAFGSVTAAEPSVRREPAGVGAPQPAVQPAPPGRPFAPVGATTPGSVADGSMAPGPVLPRWSGVSAGQQSWTPTPTAANPAPGPLGSTVVSSEDEPEEITRQHPYTWLHMVVLVLVAFVLGMLIFMVVMQDAPQPGALPDESESLVSASVDGTGD